MADLTRVEIADRPGWRSWLRAHHSNEMGAWLVFHRKDSGLPSISYDDALEEALAYGWIDSVIKKIDDRSYVRKFTPRQPWSIWSTSNIQRLERLKKEGRMTKWGLEAFAKRTDETSLLEKFNRKMPSTPSDFEDALMKNKDAWANFQRFAPSHRKRYLIWISGAKRPETRKKRIEEAVVLISRNLKDLLK